MEIDARDGLGCDAGIFAEREPRSRASGRSGHHRAFLEADTGPKLLADNAKRLRDGLFGQGVPPAR